MRDAGIFLDFARDLVREAGERIFSDAAAQSLVSDTPEKGPLVKGDLAAHALVRERIAEKFPAHALISEESDAREFLPHTWVCDPICGTYNYLRGIPYFAVSVSYLLDGEIQLAAVYNPASRELFHAVKGEGSYLNGKRIQASAVMNLSDAVVDFNVNFSSVSERALGKRLFTFLSPPTTARLRLTESANLDLAYVACGRYDAYLHPSDKIWDKTAGKLLVEEAGGYVTDFGEKDHFTLLGEGVIAANGALLRPLKEAVSGLFTDNEKEL